MYKYYIEIVNTKDGEYCMQSKWFDTEAQALKFYNQIDLIAMGYKAYLMKAFYDLETEEYGDIEQVKKL